MSAVEAALTNKRKPGQLAPRAELTAPLGLRHRSRRASARLPDVKQAALDIRGVLERSGFSPGRCCLAARAFMWWFRWFKSKLGGGQSFCQDFAELLARTDPSRFVANMSKMKRRGRIFPPPPQRPGRDGYLPLVNSRSRRSSLRCASHLGRVASFENAAAFDVFTAATRAQGPDAWQGFFDVEQTLTDRIRKAVR